MWASNFLLRKNIFNGLGQMLLLGLTLFIYVIYICFTYIIITTITTPNESIRMPTI